MYTNNSTKGLILILEVDLEYPSSLHKLHNDHPLAAEKLKVTEEMLSRYWVTIRKKYKISIGHVKKLIPTLTGADLGGGCRGCAPPWDDQQFSNTTGILRKKKSLCGLLVLKSSKRRVHPLLKKILDPPLSKYKQFPRKGNDEEAKCQIFALAIYSSYNANVSRNCEEAEY